MTLEFDDRYAIIDKGRHDAVRIELEIFGLELFFLGEVNAHLVELGAFLVQHQPDFLAARGVRGVVQN